MSALLEVQDVHTYYGESYVLQGVSLNVPEGRVVALLGRNGVGKTTVIRSIIGFTPPRRGVILFKGVEITGREPHTIARLGVGLVPQGRRIFPSLTVGEHLTLRRPRSDTRWAPERILGVFPRLRERLLQRGGSLSGGEQQMLATGRGLAPGPRLLLMDEPSEGLSPLIVTELRKVIQDIRSDGAGILLVEQNLPFALSLADHVYLMSKGRVVYEGTAADLDADSAMKAQYLGI